LFPPKQPQEHYLDRRSFLLASLATSVALSRSTGVRSAEESRPFDSSRVRTLARDLAAKPFKAPDLRLPDNLAKIGYDEYRSIRFLPERAVWHSEKLPFELQFFHRGFLYSNSVEIFQVFQGRAEPIQYSPDLFSFGQVTAPSADAPLGFAGFRIHAPLNRPDYYDEVGAFVGASYFRAVAKGLTYGLSARGLAIGTANSKGEEFPYFKAFWIERPAQRANSLVVHALLDSQSASAAYRFSIRPGDTTVYDVEMALYPRVDIDELGVAPISSMFFFDSNDRNDIDDYRPAVHDSDGMAIRNGRGESIWRPLSNPRDLQISTFADSNPRGFGLIQRQRNFSAYEDLESRFEKRPSLWAEPIGDWGEGAVHLVEIPTKTEYHDNIVAFWKHKEAAHAKGEYILTYRLHWGVDIPNPPSLARVMRTSVGAGPDDSRLFVIDFAGDALKAVTAEAVKAIVNVDRGETRNIVAQRNRETGGWRLSFQLHSQKEPVIELRAQLLQKDDVLTETWVYRWTS
jgi:glucans biosynthesis protein